MKLRISVFAVLFLLLILNVILISKAGIWLVKDETGVHSDAMVILMGSISDRVLQAENVYKEGLADEIIIVEESMGAYKALDNKGVKIISNTKQVHDALVTLGVPPDSITILAGDAISTQMEAMIVREYCNSRSDIDTLLLVSSAHHTRRASIIFKSAFRREVIPVTILCSPSVYSFYDPHKWWRDKEGIQKVLLEYMKIANFLLVEKWKL